LLSNEEIVNYRPSENHLIDKVILVTGAGAGIGEAAALACAKAGATVILAGRTIGKLESVYDAIVAAGWPEPLIFPVDFQGATPDDYRDMAEAIDTTCGRLDGLLHNAGILGQRTPLNHYPQTMWDQVLQINLTSQFAMTQSLMPVLEKSDQASVLFTTSSVGRVGRAFWGAYAISKFAIEGMVQTWAVETEGIGNVRVNAINPGATRTNMRAQAFPAENPESLKTPEQIMPAYLYLLGDDSAGVSGQSIDAQIRKPSAS
jgi:NAD(P)-dependent dehydrogenase (short-subunit alcohol dehydrogenase family)